VSVARQRELLVLSTLHAHPMHGYALAEVVEAGLGPAVGLTRATIYAILKRFEERGWIAGEVDRDGGRPPRSVFHVTPDGEAALPGLVAACARERHGTPAPLALFVAHLDGLPVDERRACVARHLADREERLRELDAAADHPGNLGVALRLMRGQVALEIETLRSLGIEPTRDRH
jgi:DNA-binding PadR family transcriptional regulator